MAWIRFRLLGSMLSKVTRLEVENRRGGPLLETWTLSVDPTPRVEAVGTTSGSTWNLSFEFAGRE